MMLFENDTIIQTPHFPHWVFFIVL